MGGITKNAYVERIAQKGILRFPSRNFCERIGVSKVNSVVEYSFLEHCLREDLNMTAQRVMAVLDPIKLIITNYPEDLVEKLRLKIISNVPEDGLRNSRLQRILD